MTVETLLDTTVLVAGLIAAHPQYAHCRPHLAAAGAHPGAYRCTTHAIAETFRVLVALPLNPRLDADGARMVIRTSLLPRLNPVALTAKDYDRALDVVTRSGLGAGAIYDCLHLLAAERLGAKRLLTANLKHFARLATAAEATVSIQDPAQST